MIHVVIYLHLSSPSKYMVFKLTQRRELHHNINSNNNKHSNKDTDNKNIAIEIIIVNIARKTVIAIILRVATPIAFRLTWLSVLDLCWRTSSLGSRYPQRRTVAQSGHAETGITRLHGSAKIIVNHTEPLMGLMAGSSMSCNNTYVCLTVALKMFSIAFNIDRPHKTQHYNRFIIVCPTTTPWYYNPSVITRNTKTIRQNLRDEGWGFRCEIDLCLSLVNGSVLTTENLKTKAIRLLISTRITLVWCIDPCHYASLLL